MPQSSTPEHLVRLFAALADPTRLRLLNLIQGREVCVCYFVEILGQSQPKISRHLAYLRKAGLVSARREGTWMHYRITPITDPGTRGVLESTLAAVAHDPTFSRDITRLNQACCEPQRYVQLEDAPRPATIPAGV
jgi:ArsR family transcriptional regulator